MAIGTSKGSSVLSPQSAVALRRLLEWIERRFGGRIPMDPSATVLVSRDHHLHAADLQRLLRHEITALHVRGFYPAVAAQALGRELAREATAQGARNWRISTSRGLESSDVSTLGCHPPHNVAAANGTLEEYFGHVLQEMDNRRFESSNASSTTMTTMRREPKPLWPLDLLRLQLDEVWPAGAGLARDEQRRLPYSGGLPRIMQGPTRWKQGFVHVDEMGPLSVKRGLFSANIYLQLPGEADSNDNNCPDQDQAILQVWPTAIYSRWDWYRNAVLLSGLSIQDMEAQMRLRQALGPPQVVSGRSGDLILLCVQRPHAAVGFTTTANMRVSLQCFLQHHGPHQRLLIDA